MIGCIGWGSLIWDRRNLDVDGEWRADGPMLPVEFARQSSDGRITLVLVRGFAPVPTLWSRFNTGDLARARESLRQREGVPRSRAGDLMEAAVWTNLPPKFGGIDERVPTENEVVAYLRALQGEDGAAAEQYVRQAPRQIATAYRRAIEGALGWTPMD